MLIMKRKIIFFILLLAMTSGMATAQTTYYQNTTTYSVGSGSTAATYKCDNVDGNVTLYNSSNPYVHMEWGNTDGSPMDSGFWLGEKRAMTMTVDTDPAIQAKIRSAVNTLTSQQKSLIGDETFVITLYINTQNAKVMGAEFSFTKGMRYKYIHPNFFRAIETAFTNSPGTIQGLAVIPEARKLNYASFTWIQGIQF
jgi:hypothetical protein